MFLLVCVLRVLVKQMDLCIVKTNIAVEIKALRGATLAKMVEQWSSDQKVPGSIPDPAVKMSVSLGKTLSPILIVMLHHQFMNVWEVKITYPVLVFG